MHRKGFHCCGGQVVDRTVVLGQLGDGGDAGVDQPGALSVPQTRDEQDVVGGVDLRVALRAAQAGPRRRVTPPDRPPVAVVAVEEFLQSPAARPVHRHEFSDRVGHHRAVTERELDSVVDGHTVAAQGVGVGGQLQQRGDLGRAGEFGVAQPIGVALQHQEVGEAQEAAVEHRRLSDHRGAAPHRLAGGVRRGRQRGAAVSRASDDRGVRAEFGAELVEVPLLVVIAEARGAGQQPVIRCDLGPSAQLGVEGA